MERVTFFKNRDNLDDFKDIWSLFPAMSASPFTEHMGSKHFICTECKVPEERHGLVTKGDSQRVLPVRDAGSLLGQQC